MKQLNSNISWDMSIKLAEKMCLFIKDNLWVKLDVYFTSKLWYDLKDLRGCLNKE